MGNSSATAQQSSYQVGVGERLLSSRLFGVMVRRRGEDTITIRNYLYKLPANNLAFLMKTMKDIRLLKFLPDPMREKFMTGIVSLRQGLDPAVLPRPVYLGEHNQHSNCI